MSSGRLASTRLPSTEHYHDVVYDEVDPLLPRVGTLHVLRSRDALTPVAYTGEERTYPRPLL